MRKTLGSMPSTIERRTSGGRERGRGGRGGGAGREGKRRKRRTRYKKGFM